MSATILTNREKQKKEKKKALKISTNEKLVVYRFWLHVFSSLSYEAAKFECVHIALLDNSLPTLARFLEFALELEKNL
jgi:hypothetical protein